MYVSIHFLFGRFGLEGRAGVEGPIKLSNTGKQHKAWKRPNSTSMENILKNVLKAYASLNANKKKAKNVLNPPFRTALPISSNDFLIFSSRVPVFKHENITPKCAA